MFELRWLCACLVSFGCLIDCVYLALPDWFYLIDSVCGYIVLFSLVLFVCLVDCSHVFVWLVGFICVIVWCHVFAPLFECV